MNGRKGRYKMAISCTSEESKTKGNLKNLITLMITIIIIIIATNFSTYYVPFTVLSSEDNLI